MKLNIDNFSQKKFNDTIIFKDVLKKGLKENTRYNLGIWANEIIIFKR